MSYELGLLLFSGVVLAVIAIGGIKGVALAIVFQGIVMTIAVLALTAGSVTYAAPLEATLKGIGQASPNLLSPWSWPVAYHMSMWLNFGFVIIGLPHAAVGALTYKDTRAMHKAILIGGVFVVLWTMTLPYLGILANAIVPGLKVADHAIPALAMVVLPPWLAGITLAGVTGAIQSTVGAMIIVITSSLVKMLIRRLSGQTPPRRASKKNSGPPLPYARLFLPPSVKPPQAPSIS